MQPTNDGIALIQTVHGTSFPLVGLARVSQAALCPTPLCPGSISTPLQMGHDSGTSSSPLGQGAESPCDCDCLRVVDSMAGLRNDNTTLAAFEAAGSSK